MLDLSVGGVASRAGYVGSPGSPAPLLPGSPGLASLLSPLRRWFPRALVSLPFPAVNDRFLLSSTWDDDVVGWCDGTAWKSLCVRWRGGGRGGIETVEGWEPAAGAAARDPEKSRGAREPGSA